MILVGDIGGTNARFALVEADRAEPVRQGTVSSRAHPSLEAAARAFLGDAPPPIHTATLGVAGPVVDNRCTATNLPWVVDGDALGRALGIERVTLLNDLVALAYGALRAPREKLRILQGGAPSRDGATVAVLAAGTGLGEAALVWSGERHVPLPTEGGHTDFAPRDDLEIELLRFLRARHHGRVSYERILSGRGIGALYEFFRDVKGLGDFPPLAEAIASAPDPNVEIVRRGVAGDSDACARAVELFASLYGAEAGNLALKTFATGGVFVAGGIAAKLLPVIERVFLPSFRDKGRFSSTMEKIPVAVVVDSSIGLAGSAYHALNLS